MTSLTMSCQLLHKFCCTFFGRYCEFAMLNGSVGIAHLNMDNGDNRVANLKYVTEAEARRLLLEYVE